MATHHPALNLATLITTYLETRLDSNLLETHTSHLPVHKTTVNLQEVPATAHLHKVQAMVHLQEVQEAQQATVRHRQGLKVQKEPRCRMMSGKRRRPHHLVRAR